MQEALVAGAVINAINYAEVLSRFADAGKEPMVVDHQLRTEGLIGSLLPIVPVDDDDAVAIARLRTITRESGLSLGDRACLATGMRRDR